MQTEMMQVKVESSTHAYRVNGITLAKRHLKAAFPSRADDELRLIWSYLALVPYLHQAFDVSIKASRQIKYLAAKSHRVYHSIGLGSDSDLPFMLIALQGAGELEIKSKMSPDEIEAAGKMFHKLADILKDGMAPKAKVNLEDSGDNVVPFPGRTVH